VSTPLESVLPGCGPQAVLRVREYGPIGENGPADIQVSTSGSHGAEAARRRRPKGDLWLMHDETGRGGGAGEGPMEVPPIERGGAGRGADGSAAHRASARLFGQQGCRAPGNPGR